jgi:hypothetical protein
MNAGTPARARRYFRAKFTEYPGKPLMAQMVTD